MLFSLLYGFLFSGNSSRSCRDYACARIVHLNPPEITTIHLGIQFLLLLVGAPKKSKNFLIFYIFALRCVNKTFRSCLLTHSIVLIRFPSLAERENKRQILSDKPNSTSDRKSENTKPKLEQFGSAQFIFTFANSRNI